MLKVYLVEDDSNIREIVKYALETKEYEFMQFEDSTEFWSELSKTLPDLIILDLMLPTESGVEILKKLKKSDYSKDVPVIVLSAKSSEFDKLFCFDLGADDYIVKPFSVLELLARINAVTKRVRKNVATEMMFENIKLDLNTRKVTVDKEAIELTLKEFEVLRFLLENVNIVVEREKLISKVWGYDYVGDSRTIDVHINTLRKKLGMSKDVIKTVRGIGYIIND